MKPLDTPLGPEARAATTAAGTGGKGQLKRLSSGERDERGAAFNALLKNRGLKTADGKASSTDIAGKPAAIPLEVNDDKAKLVGDMLAATGGPLDHGQATPGADPVAAAVAMLTAPLPSKGKPAEAVTDAEEPASPQFPRPERALSAMLGDDSRAEPHGSDDSHLPGAGQAGTRQAGPAMPSDVKAAASDPSAFTRLAAALKDTKAPQDLPAPHAAASEQTQAQAGADERGKAEPAARGSENTAPMIIAITHQETHLPPVMKFSPFQQVVEPIRLAAAELASSSGPAYAALEPDSLKPSEISTPTKLLHLELRPVELGTITVKLRLSQGGMDIRIEASRAETATMLGQDKEALRDVIRASGYSSDAVSIEAIHVEVTPGDWQRGQHRQDDQQIQTANGREGERGFNEFRQEQGREAPRRGWEPDVPPSKEEHHEMAESGRASNDPHLYL